MKMNTAQIHSSRRTASTNIQTWKAVISRNAGLVSKNCQLARSDIKDARWIPVGSAALGMLTNYSAPPGLLTNFLPWRGGMEKWSEGVLERGSIGVAEC